MAPGVWTWEVQGPLERRGFNDSSSIDLALIRTLFVIAMLCKGRRIYRSSVAESSAAARTSGDDDSVLARHVHCLCDSFDRRSSHMCAFDE
jgi:hypothetical protein